MLIALRGKKNKTDLRSSPRLSPNFSAGSWACKISIWRLAESQGALGGLGRGSVEDPPTGGAKPGNEAISRPVDKPNQALSFIPDWGLRQRAQPRYPQVEGDKSDLVIAAQDCIKLKEANDTTFLGHQDQCTGHLAQATVLNLQGFKVFSK